MVFQRFEPVQLFSFQTGDFFQNLVKITNQYDQITENTEIQPSQVAEETPETPIYTKEVAELIEKSADITSFSYLYTSSIRDEHGNYVPEDDYEAQVKNNKIKKIYPEANKLEVSFFKVKEAKEAKE